MLVKATRSFRDDAGNIRPGQIIDMTDFRGADLIRRGLAIDVQGKAGAAPGPTLSPQTDTRTGGETQSSSSRAGQAPRELTSPPATAARGSSRSTTASGSRRSPTSSTPATAPGGSQKADTENSLV